MRIDSIYLKDVGPFDEVTIEFPRGTDDSLADVYLLTGENGSGKSTVLYAIAFLLGAGNSLPDRMRGPLSTVILTADGTVNKLVGRADHSVFHAPRNAQAPSSWAAFAYSGARKLESGHLQALREPVHDPFEQSLSFHDTANTQHLAQWIASQDYKRLKAKDAGDHVEAERLRRGIRDIEQAVGHIIDDESFAFIPHPSRLDILVRRHGSEVGLDLLPDGLKAIVSWVADLLMRLERIPWIDSTPPRERSFLLLLDEIDIHLHPAWQRRILPMVQRFFPKAQIIATTHSPFVVASAADARIIRFELQDGVSTLDPTPRGAQIGTSVSAIQRDVFGVESEFDIDTEALLVRFHDEKRKLLAGESADRAALDGLARQIASRGEELSAIIGYELRQLDRMLAAPKHAAG